MFTTEIIAILVGIISTVLGTLIFEWIRSYTRISVKLIKKSSDKDTESFLELYEKLFDEDQRIDSAEIVTWIDEDRVLRNLETHNYLHYLLVGKIGSNVVCFLKAMYRKDTKYMYIAYYGIDTSIDRSRKLAAPAVMKRLISLINKDLKDCKAVIAEVRAPDTKLDYQENNKRKARVRLFKETAKRFKYPMYEIDIVHFQPKMDISDDDQFSDEKSILLYCPVNDTLPFNKKISKEKMFEILRFLLLQIYRPTYRHDPEKDFKYQRYLYALLKKYNDTLPEYIQLKD